MDIVSAITTFLKRALGIVLSMLPTSPIRPFIDDLAAVEWLGYLNWVVPVGTFVTIGSAWLVAIGIFYAYQLILRWVKAVGD